MNPRRIVLSGVISLLTGCAPTIEMTGMVFEDRFDGAAGLEGAVVTVRDLGGEEVSSSPTGADGTFALDAPKSIDTIFATVQSDLGPTASFRGVSGLDPFDVPAVLAFDDGNAQTDDRILLEGSPVPSFYAVADAEMTALATQFAGCPGADSTGAVVVGAVRYYLFGNDGTGRPDPDFTPPAVRRARIRIEGLGANEATQTACYLDANGLLYDPQATNAGDAQVFALFDVDPGLYLLTVEFDITDSTFTTSSYEVWVPPGGVVPRFPLWVEFPMF